ncbi:MAG: RluA family pseudouridine synthase [Armatimonadetes bacterium]|nr:RluA family pseudouridine synthase [Armatimonadota bacterium]
MNEELEITAFEVDESDRLDKFLKRMLPDFSRTKLVEVITGGFVTVDGIVRKPGHEVREGMQVEIVDLPDAAPTHLEPIKMDLEIVYEDADLLVVNKPRGLPTHPASSYPGATLVHGLLAHADTLSTGSSDFRPGIVHRLDKETTGLLVVAKSDFAHAHLAKQIADKAAERRYFALAYGTTEQVKFRVAAPIARDPRNRLKMSCQPVGRDAATQFRRFEIFGGGSLLSCKLETGRTHQIRVHLQAIGHPVKGDALYATGPWAEGPMQLHAALLCFVHPRSGEAMEFYLAPPESFIAHELCTRESLNF